MGDEMQVIKLFQEIKELSVDGDINVMAFWLVILLMFLYSALFIMDL